jgi:hypothetical protein
MSYSECKYFSFSMTGFCFLLRHCDSSYDVGTGNCFTGQPSCPHQGIFNRTWLIQSFMNGVKEANIMKWKVSKSYLKCACSYIDKWQCVCQSACVCVCMCVLCVDLCASLSVCLSVCVSILDKKFHNFWWKKWILMTFSEPVQLCTSDNLVLPDL